MKIKILVSWITAALITVSGILILRKTQTNTETIIRHVYIKVIGAVRESKIIDVPANSTMKEILLQIQLSRDADKSQLDINRHFINDATIIIPYKDKDKKIIIGREFNKHTLSGLGVSNSIKEQLFDYFKESKKWTWEDIDSLRGVGPITLKLLKSQLDISYGS